ncbi:MAG TPA: chalcone isomerase family protein [Candidatus Binatia bacterium]|nr:chalcone isomerase family protein [Candidatus Binatia bacterium]
MLSPRDRIIVRVGLALAACLTACVATPALAGERAGVTLPDQATVEGRTLALNGMGLRKATWLRVKVYVAGLYLEEKSTDADAILSPERTKRVVLVFVRAVGRDDLLDAWGESFQENEDGDLAAMQASIATFHGLMPDRVAKGETFTFTYVPGTGVLVAVRDETRGTVPGAAFARSLFATWLGKKTPSPALKAGLLGLR